jgi:hypothetical protein
MRFFLKSAALAAGILAAAGSLAVAQEQNPGEVARFYAGLPVPAESPVGKFTQDRAWQAYSKAFGDSWEKIDSRQLGKVRTWTAANVKGSKDTLYYFFGGPDFLYANLFYPNAKTYILVGLEPVGPVPQVDARTVQVLPAVRAALEHSLNLSFFITQDMNSRLRGQTVKGTLPLIYVYMARSGATIKEVKLIQLDKDGTEVAAGEFKGRALAPGVKITFAKEDGVERTLYYFSTDLSNGGVAASGLLKFAEKFGQGNALFKSASYLPHGGGFSAVRDFVLKHADVIVQDDTGVPVRFFKRDEWELTPFGVYIGPIPIFGMGPEGAAQQLWHPKNKPPKLEFGIGYRNRITDSNLLFATRKEKKN